MVFNVETQPTAGQQPTLRHDWTHDDVLELLRLPFGDLIYQAQTVHRAFFAANTVQISTLLSIKTGGCPEDCAYCPQSAHFNTGLEPQNLLAKEAVLTEAKRAQSAGATRFCMRACWAGSGFRRLRPARRWRCGCRLVSAARR